MPEPADVSGLEVTQDLAFQKRAWQVERAAWVVIGVTLAVAALGLFGGSGPLMATTLSGGGSIEIDYDRFARFGAPTFLEFELGAGDSTRNVAVSRSWLADYAIDGVLPQPESTTALPDRYVFTFDAGSTGKARLLLTPREAGRQRATIWSDEGDRIEFTQIVYP